MALLQQNPAAPQWVTDLEAWLASNPWIGGGATLLALFVLSAVVWLLTSAIALPLLRRLIKRTAFEWDDVFLESNAFKWLGYIPPAIVFALSSEILEGKVLGIQLPVEISALGFVQQLAEAFIVFCTLMALNAVLTAANILYDRRESSGTRPIKGYIQLLKIFLFVVFSVCAIAIAVGGQPWEFLKYIAGLTAVLLFVFKDTILSLLASIQLTSNRMLHVGDWIEVPSAGVDGDVMDVALHTVKVRNFDKTVVTVPTRKLVEGTFKNWRGMSESGGRRIKRSIHIDMSTIRFLEADEIEKFEKIALLRDYITEKKQALAEANQAVDDGSGINFRRLTNVGTFRAYVIAYLRSLPKVHGEFTFLVRQLEPGETGLPLQVYFFTDTTAWVEYEAIQSDIFDHLLAALTEFDLRVFQLPTGFDFRKNLEPPATAG